MRIVCYNAKMIKFKYKQLGDSTRYSVIGKDDGREYAIFSLLYTPYTRPAFCKHLALDILQVTATEILAGNIVLLRDICDFVFRAVLKITHEEKGAELCKIYSSNIKVITVYRKFAAELGDEYEVKSYRNWLEILKKDKNLK